MPTTRLSGEGAHLDETPPAFRLLGRRLVGVDGAGEVTIAFEAQPEFINRHGTVQGGFRAAMLDSATALMLMKALPVDQTAVTTRLDTTFVKPASPGALTAHARILEREARRCPSRDSRTSARTSSPSGRAPGRGNAVRVADFRDLVTPPVPRALWARNDAAWTRPCMV
jgi:uncharacterized protein (TIGR00369 family)